MKAKLCALFMLCMIQVLQVQAAAGKSESLSDEQARDIIEQHIGRNGRVHAFLRGAVEAWATASPKEKERAWNYVKEQCCRLHTPKSLRVLALSWKETAAAHGQSGERKMSDSDPVRLPDGSHSTVVDGQEYIV